MPFFGFALAVAYWPGWAGAASSPRWAVLVAFAVYAFVFVSEVRERAGVAHLLGGLFVLYALASGFWSAAPEAFDLHWKLAAVAALFLAGTGIDSLRSFLLGAAAGVGVNSGLVVLDLLGFVSYPQVSRPSGLFVNGLYLAEFSAMVLVGCLALREWWYAAACVPSIALVTLARGPLVALAVAGIVWVWSRSRNTALALMAVMAGAIPTIARLRPDTVQDRLDGWLALAQNITPAGAGLGRFFGDWPFMLPGDAAGRKLHANNDLLEVAYDLGLIGASLALLFVVVVLWPAARGRSENAARMMVIVFAVEGCFGFPFFLPWTVGLFALAAGRLCRDGGAWMLPAPVR